MLPSLPDRAERGKAAVRGYSISAIPSSFWAKERKQRCCSFVFVRACSNSQNILWA